MDLATENEKWARRYQAVRAWRTALRSMKNKNAQDADAPDPGPLDTKDPDFPPLAARTVAEAIEAIASSLRLSRTIQAGGISEKKRKDLAALELSAGLEANAFWRDSRPEVVDWRRHLHPPSIRISKSVEVPLGRALAEMRTILRGRLSEQAQQGKNQ